MSSRLILSYRHSSDSRLPPSLSRVTPSAVSEHFSELLGCPISRPRTACCVCLELRPLPSTGITRLQGYCEPLRHPSAPGLSLTGVRLIILITHWGFPCCARFPCVHAAATTPVQRLGVLVAHTQRCQPSPEGSPGRPAHRPFRGLLGVHSRCGLHTRAVTVFRDPLSEGFRHFVTSMPAPVASGWSGRRVGLAPTGKRRLFTAHTQLGHSTAPASIGCFWVLSSVR